MEKENIKQEEDKDLTNPTKYIAEDLPEAAWHKIKILNLEYGSRSLIFSFHINQIITVSHRHTNIEVKYISIPFPSLPPLSFLSLPFSP
jgi:predicted Zn-dependent peptidase